MLDKVNRFLKINNEWMGLPLALLIYYLTPQLLRLVEPTAGEYDLGQLQTLAFGTVKILAASFLSGVGYRLNYPLMYKYFIGPLEQDITLTGERGNATALLHLVKGVIHLLVYFAYMALAMWSFQTV